MAEILCPWKLRHLPQAPNCGGKAGRTCWQHQKVLLGGLQVHGKEVQGLFPIMSEPPRVQHLVYQGDKHAGGPVSTQCAPDVAGGQHILCVLSHCSTVHGSQQEFDGGMDEGEGKGLRSPPGCVTGRNTLVLRRSMGVSLREPVLGLRAWSP